MQLPVRSTESPLCSLSWNFQVLFSNRPLLLPDPLERSGNSFDGVPFLQHFLAFRGSFLPQEASASLEVVAFQFLTPISDFCTLRLPPVPSIPFF